MTNVIFEILTKAGLILTAVILTIAWFNAGCPFWTITRR